MDLYGHQISINFDNSGDNYKTNIGGVISLILTAALIALFSIDLQNMLNHENDAINDETVKHDSENIISWK